MNCQVYVIPYHIAEDSIPLCGYLSADTQSFKKVPVTAFVSEHREEVCVFSDVLELNARVGQNTI